jgi:hypothetical protein
LDHVFYRATDGKPRQLFPSEHLIFVVVVIVVLGFVVVVSVLVLIDSNASVAGAASYRLCLTLISAALSLPTGASSRSIVC